MITTLIFDLGNVILTNDWHDGNDEKFQVFAKYFQLSFDEMETGWNQAWPLFRVGKITEDDFWTVFLQLARSKPIDIMKAKELWKQYQEPIDGMLPLLAAFHKKYILGALTDTGKEWLDYKIPTFHLNSYFTEILSSGYYGKGKPEKEVYEAILANLHVLPQNSVFIDDKEKLLVPAEQLGMTTVQFKNKNQLVEALKAVGVSV